MDKNELKTHVDKMANSAGTIGREAAILNAQNAIVEDLAGTIHAFSEALTAELSGLRQSMGHLASSFDSAAESGNRSADRMATLTKVLVGATIAYTLIAGGGLVYSMVSEPKIACEGSVAK